MIYNKQTGNFVAQFRPQYLTSRRADKPRMALQIVAEFQEMHAMRFLIRKNKNADDWEEATMEQVREKTSQLLREKHKSQSSQTVGGTYSFKTTIHSDMMMMTSADTPPRRHQHNHVNINRVSPAPHQHQPPSLQHQVMQQLQMQQKQKQTLQNDASFATVDNNNLGSTAYSADVFYHQQKQQQGGYPLSRRSSYSTANYYYEHIIPPIIVTETEEV